MTITMKLAMCFMAGICFCLLLGQARLPKKYNPETPVGRFQLIPRGTTMGVWIVDTTNGDFQYHEATPNSSKVEFGRYGRYAPHFE